MDNWIPFENESYMTKRSFLMAPDNTAVELERTIVEIFTGHRGKKQLTGSGIVRNVHMMELLEENDDLDLILDFGAEYKYRLITPRINAGKVFDPHAKSTLKFSPVSPWNQIPEPEYEKLLKNLRFIHESIPL